MKFDSKGVKWKMLESCYDPKVSLSHVSKTSWPNFRQLCKNLIQYDAHDIAKIHVEKLNSLWNLWLFFYSSA